MFEIKDPFGHDYQNLWILSTHVVICECITDILSLSACVYEKF